MMLVMMYGMALNPSKSDAILFGTAQRLKTMSSLTSVKIAYSAIQFSDTVKILGVTLDSNLTLGPHIKAISKSCFYHIRSFRQIRHRWIVLWPWLLLLLWCRQGLIMRIRSFSGVHRSTYLAFSEYSPHLPES